MTETLEQIDYFIGELSKSTNERHAQERHEILTRLQVMRDIAVLTPSELAPLPPDSRRIVFKTKTEMMIDFRTNAAKWEEIYDTHGTRLQMSPDGRLVLDIIPYSVIDRETGEFVQSEPSGSESGSCA
jgi:hypothetical protein